MERRQFIKQSCLSCAGIIAGGTLISLMESCVAMPVYNVTEKTNIIEVPKSKFVESNIVMIKTPWLSNDILLVKKTETDYNALYMQCSHEDQILTATNNGLYCSAHGSVFDLDGNVQKEPALKPLRKFKTTINNETITITLKN